MFVYVYVSLSICIYIYIHTSWRGVCEVAANVLQRASPLVSWAENNVGCFRFREVQLK